MDSLTILARDGYELAATVFGAPDRGVVVMNSAMAVEQRFYRRFATSLAHSGYEVVTYDYRGIGQSGSANIRESTARAGDWITSDMAGVVDWAATRSERVFLVGHSFGGQTAGLLDNADQISGMITVSSQSGYWRLQGGAQKAVFLFHTYVTLPALARLFGYVPWSKVGGSTDIPKGVAQDWARWGRSSGYLLGDTSLPLERFADFTAPVLAYSVGDDSWGPPAAVDAMMAAYPNVERRHIEPAEVGIASIGHMGFFRESAAALWPDLVAWMNDR